MQGVATTCFSIGDETEFDVVKDGEIITLNETGLDNYFKELIDKRSTIISKLKAVK